MSMIMCLAATHSSIFNICVRAFFIKLACESISVSFISFYQQTFLIILHLLIQILTLEIHRFNHYVILTSAINYQSCENQLSYGFL